MNNDRWQQVEQLLSGALSHPPAERSRFLDEACGGDPDLRREVESLLAWEDKGQGFLDRPAAVAQGSPAVEVETLDLSGKAIAHYRVLSKLGEGGMGVVYRAQDSQLDRQVALKLLPDEFAQDAARLARFEREAKLLASLSHPNIATVYGLEQSDGRRILAMELIEGETLAGRLRKGAIPVPEALEICRQIAAGLEAAHEKGVIHRDLKPGNVMITREGKVKILDFGLARASQPDGAPPDAARSMTGSGVILGTAAYMSPEQATGKPVDKRADIWAFGCVLYECLTGRRLFHPGTIEETIAKILEGAPDWDSLPQKTPASIRLLLRWCLQKDPGHRLRDIADMRIAIEESLVGASLASAFIAESPRARPVWRRMIPWAVAGLVAVAATIALWQERALSPRKQSTSRLVVSLPQDQRWKVGIWGPQIAISRDGSKLVYQVRQGELTYLCLRRIDEYEARRIPGTEGAFSPFFSPDGMWVGFYAGGKFWKVSSTGGNPQLIGNTSDKTGATWGDDNTIILGGSGCLCRIPAAGGAEERLEVKLYEKEGGDRYFRHPQLLPGGKSVLFTVKRAVGNMQVGLLSLETGEARILVERGCSPQYTASGHLVYGWEGELLAAPFDLATQRLTGTPIPVLQGVITESMGLASYSVSEDGTLAYAPGELAGRSLPIWMNRKGEEDPLPLFEKRHYSYPRLSRDGKLFMRWSGEAQKIMVRDLQRGTDQLLSKREGDDSKPVCHPDGQYVVFAAIRKGSAMNIWRKYLDGSEREERLTESSQDQYPQDFSPDGSVLAFVEARRVDTTRRKILDIFLLNLDGKSKPRPLFNSAALRSFAAFSPDGRWIAYVSLESQPPEVWVVDYPRASRSFQISSRGGWAPLWAPDGRELFYWSGYWGPDFFAVPFSAESPYRHQKSSILFRNDQLWGAYSEGRGYDIAPDGRRFLMLKRIMPEFQQINVVQNWFSELERLCPTGK